MLRDIGAVNLGDNERHIRVHAESVAVVHHSSPRLNGCRKQCLGNGIVRRTQHDVATSKGLRRGLFNHHVFALKLHHLACAARARQQLNGAHGEIALLQACEHLRSHSTGCTQNGDGVLLHMRNLPHRMVNQLVECIVFMFPD